MRILTAVACLAVALLFANSADAGNRVAFVVGNGAYKFVQPLPNPAIDAKAMSTLLRNAGFEVVEGTDLSRDGMTSKLREFATRSQGADVAVFYYAGHGISVNGKNYLIPVDADLKSEMDVMFGAAIDVDVTLDQTMSDSKVKLVLLDACRDNPFAAKIRSASRTRAVTVNSGLAEMKSAEGTLIAFATSPGQTALDGQKGGNSPFTKALINHIATPGVEIQQAMTRVRAQVNEETQKQQLPWGHTNLIGSVYLNPAAAPAAAPAVANATTSDSPAGDGGATMVVAAATPGSAGTTARSTGGADVEIEFWRSIKDTNKPEELNAYLFNYPAGQFRSLALARLAAIDLQQKAPSVNTSQPVDPATFTAEATLATEDSVGLDRRKRSQVQRRLSSLGFDVRSSGKFDDETRRVITRWQTARGYPSTGFFNKLQVAALMNEVAPKSASQDEIEESRPARSERRRGGGRRHAGGGGGGRRQGGFGAPPPIFNVLGGFGRR